FGPASEEATGWSGPSGGPCRPVSSGTCGGRPSMLSRTRSPACRPDSGWRASRRSRTSTTPQRSGERQVLLQARHELDEIARAVPVVELVDEDAFPRVAAGARASRKREEVGAAR